MLAFLGSEDWTPVFASSVVENLFLPARSGGNIDRLFIYNLAYLFIFIDL